MKTKNLLYVEKTKRNEDIVKMRKEGYSYGIIGRKYKITSERARQIYERSQKSLNEKK